MKKKLIIPMTIWATMTVCLYGATFAEVNTCTKIVSGIAFAILYANMIVTPYFIAKCKGGKKTLLNYLETLIFEH